MGGEEGEAENPQGDWKQLLLGESLVAGPSAPALPSGSFRNLGSALSGCQGSRGLARRGPCGGEPRSMGIGGQDFSPTSASLAPCWRFSVPELT